MRVKVKVPKGARLDRDRVLEAIRAALSGDEEHIWSLNSIPAIAQLEENLYQAGSADIQRAWEATAQLLGLPVAPMQKSTARQGAGNFQDRVRAAFFGGG